MTRVSSGLAALSVSLALALAGCSSPNSGSASSTFANIVMFQSTTPPPPPPPDPSRADEDIECPAVTIADSGAAIRAYGGATGDSQGLRNQLSITDVARECSGATPSGSYSLKVGVQGRVLIGPAGSPGSYQSGLRITVRQGSKVIVNRVVRVGAVIPAGQSGADFVHVEQGIAIPPYKGPGTTDVEVSLEGGGGRPARRARR